MPDVEAVNAYLQRYLRANNLHKLPAVDAASALDRAGLLLDSTTRPGVALRRLLRAGKIRGAVQEANGRWFICRTGTLSADGRGGVCHAGAAPAESSGGTGAVGPRHCVLPDVLHPVLAVVFVGESAGELSALQGAYYADISRNRFWCDLASCGITEKKLQPCDFTRLPEYGIGLTDVFKHSTNAELKRMTETERFEIMRREAPNLRRKIEHTKPEAVCFLGLKVGRKVGRVLFGWPDSPVRRAGRQLDTRLGCSQVWLCPSTSGAAAASALCRRRILSDLYEEVVKPWQERRQGER